MRRSRHILLLLLVPALLAGLYVIFTRPVELRQQRLLLGTVVEIVAYGSDQTRLETAVNDAFDEIDRLEQLMSARIPSSDVGRLSSAATQVEVSAETAEVISLGLEVAAASDGAFDMTLGHLKQLWAIDSTTPRVPTATEVATALRHTGPRALNLDERTVTKRDAGLAVDLGAIAKGYALDRAAAVLRRHHVSHASVNAGGDIVLIGTKPSGSFWRIGIQDPADPARAVAVLDLADVAVVTSGDYERFFTVDGLRYHHLFDPSTGYPSRLSRSVTVLASNAALADALATAVFVLGPERGLALLARYPGAEGMIIDASNRRHLSPGMKQVLSWH